MVFYLSWVLKIQGLWKIGMLENWNVGKTSIISSLDTELSVALSTVEVPSFQKCKLITQFNQKSNYFMLNFKQVRIVNNSFCFFNQIYFLTFRTIQIILKIISLTFFYFFTFWNSFFNGSIALTA